MKTKAWSNVLKVFVAVLIVSVMAMVVIACSGGNITITSSSDTQTGSSTSDSTSEIVGTGTETGVFYFDNNGREYLVVLNESTVTYVTEVHMIGICDQSENAFTFTFDNKVVTANLNGNVLTVTDGESATNFYKKVYFNVEFNTNGGSSVSDVEVLNGKTVAKPADPSKENAVFLGWYADEGLKVPYAFGGQVVTEATTVYAKWAETVPGMMEYTVSFDLNYEGAPAVEAVETIGGKLYNTVQPEREGYAFAGWWVSAYNDGDKLAYELTESMAVNGNVTLYALWIEEAAGTALPAPVVNVNGNQISWNDVGTANYVVTVSDANGVISQRDVQGLSATFDFNNEPAGEYTVSVMAKAESAENNSEATVRYIKNKALAPVSVINVVEPSVLLFLGVENAEKYIITIECGNEEHNHTAFDNGKSTNFNFANCPMGAEGIKFTITAEAEGYLASVSKTYIYNKVLDAVTGLKVNEETQVLSWNPVANATGYVVSVECGNSEHDHAVVNNGSSTSYCFKECAPCEGGIVFNVYPVTKGYNSPEATTLVYEKTALATPANVRVQDGSIVWDAVVGAEAYRVNVNGTVYPVEGNSIAIDAITAWKATTEVKVMALGAEDSLWSDVVLVSYNTMNDNIVYKNGVISWAPVTNAMIYEVRVNGGKIIEVDGDCSSYDVALTKEGYNTIEVRYFDGNDYSDWVSTTVFAYEVSFDSRAGANVNPVYVAYGDPVQLPETNRLGYNFGGWYNTPGGPISNGAQYNDNVFANSGAMMLYAHWVPRTYNVTYVIQNGEYCEETVTTVTYMQDYVWALATTDDLELGFVGWFSAKDCGGVQYTNSNGESFAPWSETADDIVVYAGFKEVFDFILSDDGETYKVKAGSGMTNLTFAEIPAYHDGKMVTEIAASAFPSYRASKITKLVIPDTITYIDTGFSALSGLTGLEEIEVKHYEEVTDPVIYSVDGALFRIAQGETYQKQLIFFPRMKTGEYTIPEGTEVIGTQAFYYAEVTKITVPGSVAIVSDKAFYYAKSLTEINFLNPAEQTEEDVITFGGKSVFGYCSALETITFPARYKEFNTELLPSSLSVLTNINFNEGEFGVYSSIDGVVTNKNKNKIVYYPLARLGEYEIPEGIIEIGDLAFSGNKNITEIVIPNTVTKIGDRAFYNCTYVVRLVFKGESFEPVVIGAEAFRNISKITKIEIEEGAKIGKIGDFAFQGCTMLTSFEIPATVYEIGNGAFKGCSLLGSVSFAEGGVDLSFGTYVFSDCKSLTSVYLPKNIVEFKGGVFDGCTSLASVIVDPENEALADDNGVLYNKDYTSILFYPMGRTENPVLRETVVRIEDAVFQGRTNITSINITAKVNYIGAYAFENCTNLKTITFAPRETELVIGEYAFNECVSLESIALPEGVTELSNRIFANTDSLKTVTLPSTLKKIGGYAFYYSGVEELFVPKSVTVVAADGFYYAQSLKSLIFEEGAEEEVVFETSTSGYAYTIYYCKSLETLVLPDTLTRLDKYAIYSLTALKTLEIPKSVKYIALNSLGGLTGLESLTFEEGGTEELVLEDGVMISNGSYEPTYDGVFDGMTSLKSINLPSRVTRIPSYAFYNCSSLESFTIPASVKNQIITNDTTSTFYYAIGTYAFRNCTSLRVVNYEDGGTGKLSLPNYVFYYCNALEEVNLPSRLSDDIDADGETVIQAFQSHSVFYSYSNKKLRAVNIQEGSAYTSKDGIVYGLNGTALLFVPAGYTEKLVVPKEVTYVHDYAFYYANLTEVEFEEGGTELVIGSKPNDYTYVFYYSKVKSVKLPKHLTVINGYAFYIASSLEEVIIPADSKLSFIGKMAFYKTKIESVVIPATVETISQEAFREATKLKTVTFSDAENSKLTTIGVDAFEKTAIEEIRIPNSVTTIGSGAFNTCRQLKRVYLPESIEEIPAAFADCINIQEIVISENSASLTNKEGVIYNKDMTTLYTYFSGKTDQTYVIPDTVTTIAERAFENTAYIEKVVIPASVTTIGQYAFYNSSVKTVEFLPAEATEDAEGNVVDAVEVDLAIGAYAFRYSGITEMVIPARVSVIGSYAFADTYSLESFTFAEDVSFTSIPTYAFYYSAVKEIEIPKSVTSIGNYAFRYAEVEKITFAEGNALTSTGTYSFANTAIKSINIPATVTNFGNYTFYQTLLEEVEIPAHPTNKTVTYGTNLFDKNYNLTKVVIAEGFKKGNNYMFQNCTALSDITLPSTLTTLSNSMFKGSGVVSIVIPDKVTSFGTNVFQDCVSLKEVTLPNSTATVSNYAFDGCTALEKVTFQAKSKIGKYMFQDCSALHTVVFPDGWSATTSWPTHVFNGCSSLKNFTLPSSVTKLDNYCFQGAGIESIDLSNVTTYGTYLFKDCANLKDVTLNPAMTKMPNYMFQNCTSLAQIDLPVALTELGSSALRNTGLTSVDVPMKVTKLGTYCFADCVNLVSAVLPSSLVELPTYLFQNCTSLESVNIPAGIVKINTYNFKGCTSLENINLPNGLVSIESSAFSGSGLKSIAIPEGVTDIKADAFSLCENLETVSIPSTVSSIIAGAFGASGVKSFEVNSSNANYTAINDVLYTADGAKLVAYPAGKEGNFIVPARVTDLMDNAFEGAKVSKVTIQSPEMVYGKYLFDASYVTEVVFPEETTKIAGTYMFRNTTMLKTINLPDALEEIPASMFTGSAIESIVIPASVKKIGNYAFDECAVLESVVFAEGSQLTEVGNYLFQNTLALGEITLPATLDTIGTYMFDGSGVAKVTFAEGSSLEALGNYMFQDCVNITSIELPETLTSISSSAFKGTTSLNVDFVIPAGVTTIGASAFDGSAIKSVTVPAGVTELGNNIFNNCENLESVVIPDTVVTFGNKTFMNTKKLKSIDMPSQLNKMGTEVFSGSAIESIVIPEGVTSIGSKTFQFCESLVSVELHDDITSLGGNAFEGCISLKKVTIPAGVTSINGSMFSGCTALEEVVLHDGIITINANVFTNCTAMKNLVIPSSVNTIYANAFVGWTAAQTITFDGLARPLSSWKSGWDADCNATFVWSK